MQDASTLLMERLTGLVEGFIAHLPNLTMAMVILGATWLIAFLTERLLKKVLGGMRLRSSLAAFFNKLARIAVWTIGIVAASVVVFPSITPGKMITALGLGSVAIGFAFKDIFENFLAGMLVLLREPFALGDFIECDGNEGWVEEITIRDTRLRQTDGQPIVVPNAMLFKNPVTVRTDSDSRRVRIVCGVAYDEDLDQARAVIEKAVGDSDGVDTSRDVQVFAREFGASSVDFEITRWTGSAPIDVRRSRDRVVAGIKRALDEAGIEIPFPYRTLTFKESLSVRSGGDADKEQDAQAQAA